VRKVLRLARREYVASTRTKGFLIGLLQRHIGAGVDTAAVFAAGTQHDAEEIGRGLVVLFVRLLRQNSHGAVAAFGNKLSELIL